REALLCSSMSVAAVGRHEVRAASPGIPICEAKDFFDRVVFLVSSDEMLTKGHVRYLESRLIRLTHDAGSVALTNDTHPDFQRLPEADRADMDTLSTMLPSSCQSSGVSAPPGCHTGRTLLRWA